MWGRCEDARGASWQTAESRAGFPARRVWKVRLETLTDLEGPGLPGGSHNRYVSHNRGFVFADSMPGAVGFVRAVSLPGVGEPRNRYVLHNRGFVFAVFVVGFVRAVLLLNPGGAPHEPSPLATRGMQTQPSTLQYASGFEFRRRDQDFPESVSGKVVVVGWFEPRSFAALAHREG